VTVAFLFGFTPGQFPFSEISSIQRSLSLSLSLSYAPFPLHGCGLWIQKIYAIRRRIDLWRMRDVPRHFSKAKPLVSISLSCFLPSNLFLLLRRLVIHSRMKMPLFSAYHLSTLLLCKGNNMRIFVRLVLRESQSVYTVNG
jgi:hypothetical protein